MIKDKFNTIWELHLKWAMGLLYDRMIDLDTTRVITSLVPNEYFNFAIPLVESPDKLNLNEIKNELSSDQRKIAVNLLESNQQSGFTEFMVRNNFHLDGRDSWLMFNEYNYKDNIITGDIKEIGLDEFSDFAKIANGAFESFSGNAKYLEMETNFMEGKIRSAVPDLTLKLYVIYDDGRPAANGGLFYSRKENFGYLHDAGTLKEYRGKGYQTSLIRHRINRCLEEGIENIYVTTENGGSSWRNCIKNGFEQIQLIQIFVK